MHSRLAHDAQAPTWQDASAARGPVQSGPASGDSMSAFHVGRVFLCMSNRTQGLLDMASSLARMQKKRQLVNSFPGNKE